jgi:AAA+ superfamily predicted ATPase
MSRHSWEVTQANELLHAMENFSGILICATNFAQNLDKARIRRFTFKLEFDYLDNTGKELFFERFFNNLSGSKLNQQHKLRLDAIPDLTPGDFRTVRQSIYYLGEKNVSHETLLTALEEESHAKRHSGGRKEIGFN